MADQETQTSPVPQRRPSYNSGGGSSGGRTDRRSGGGPGGAGGGRYAARPKVCQFCVDKVKRIDYKQSDMLRRFVSDRGKIRPRRQTGTCARHQRYLTIALKRARHLALLPFVGNQAR